MVRKDKGSAFLVQVNDARGETAKVVDNPLSIELYW
jgi:hypothetical protein